MIKKFKKEEQLQYLELSLLIVLVASFKKIKQSQFSLLVNAINQELSKFKRPINFTECGYPDYKKEHASELAYLVENIKNKSKDYGTYELLQKELIFDYAGDALVQLLSSRDCIVECASYYRLTNFSKYHAQVIRTFINNGYDINSLIQLPYLPDKKYPLIVEIGLIANVKNIKEMLLLGATVNDEVIDILLQEFNLNPSDSLEIEKNYKYLISCEIKKEKSNLDSLVGLPKKPSPHLPTDRFKI